MVHINTAESIKDIVSNQRQYYNTGVTKSISFRLAQLGKLKQLLKTYENEIYKALWLDLHKSKEEAYITEISVVIQDINLHIRNLKKWVRPKRVSTPMHLWPSKSKIIYEPLGVSLIIAPWNYPLQLLLNPLVGSISAGNCAVLKPSPYAPHISNLMEKMIKETFESSYIDLVQGDRNVNKLLLDQRYDIIFFTGSPSLGKVVMVAASKNLTPVVLELGGKSPAIVDKNANIEVASKRIIWGKIINAGQTCIAPDYLLVHESVKEELVKRLEESIKSLIGDNPKISNHFGRIINDSAFDRLESYLKDGRVIIGGDTDKSDKYISPTVIDDVSIDSSLMRDEIFGPILPLISFSDIEEAIELINSKEKPLSLYYFGKSNYAKSLIANCTSGGGCINDTIIHVGNHNLPFGGVGNSGMGSYHGKDSFITFSHKRSVMTSGTWIDLPFRYQPYKMFNLARKLLDK